MVEVILKQLISLALTQVKESGGYPSRMAGRTIRRWLDGVESGQGSATLTT
jgi:hypothetical protein